MIERLRKDIGDHEMVIETLRGIIGNEDMIERELLKQINKGPAWMRVPTREELWMEIKKLKGKISRKGKAKGGNEEEKSEVATERGDILKENMSEIDNTS